MLISGCQLTPKPKQNVINQNLPIVKSIRALSDINQIGLEWTPVEHGAIKGYYIYRASSNSDNINKFEHIATIKDKYASHYLDKQLVPSTDYRYFISTFASDESESKPGQVANVSTRPRLEPVPYSKAIGDLPNRIKIIWRPHPNIAVNAYRVERREVGSEKWSKVCSVKGRLSAECIDKGLKNDKTYEYRVVGKTDTGVYTQASNIMSAKTRKLPATVKNLNVSVNQPKKILLNWDRSLDENIIYYNVYSSPTSMLLFTKLGRSKDTKYEDLINSNGKTKYYKVTAVDSLGMESLKQDRPVQGKTLDIPNTPTISNVSSSGNGIILSWSSFGDGYYTYNLYKSFNGRVVKIKNITGTSYVDNDVSVGVEYEYRLTAMDKYGLESDKSDVAQVSLKRTR